MLSGMTATMRSWPHDSSAYILNEPYRSLPCLYDVKHKQYSNRHLRNSACSKLVDQMKEVDHTGCKDTRVNKINNLHSSYRRAEVAHCKKGGTSGDVIELLNGISTCWIFYISWKFLQEAHLTCTLMRVKWSKKIAYTDHTDGK
jgi:hypothetical protein